jgi:hypothetical protein
MPYGKESTVLLQLALDSACLSPNNLPLQTQLSSTDLLPLLGANINAIAAGVGVLRLCVSLGVEGRIWGEN